jgi:hypothetical protein
MGAERGRVDGFGRLEDGLHRGGDVEVIEIGAAGADGGSAVQQPGQALGGLAVDDAAIVGALLRIHPILGVAKAVAPDAGNPGRIRNLGPLNGNGPRLRRG